MKDSDCIKVAICAVTSDSRIDDNLMVNVLRGLCRVMDECERCEKGEPDAQP